MPFGSKGYARAQARALDTTVRALWRWTDGGRIPVVVDTSPCALTLKHARPELDAASRRLFDRLRILDGIELAHDVLLGRLALARLPGPVALHPVCSVHRMGLAGKLERVVSAVSEAEVPRGAGCCGFAGDRGLAVPELAEAATRAEAQEVRSRPFRGHFSSSRTCEIGLSRATGRPYRSFWHLLEEASRRGASM
jgi:D-lactate dehydrogenase